MRRKLALSALCCLLSLFLGGCQMLALLKQVQAEREDAAVSSSAVPPTRESTSLQTKPAGKASIPEAQQEALTVRGGGGRILSASLADILSWHDGNRTLSYSPNTGFYYLAEESGIQYHLLDPVERSGSYDFYYAPDYLDMAEDQYGSFRYDFENGAYSPSDFTVISFHVWGDALTALFEGEEHITPQRLNEIFDTVRYAHWTRGEEDSILYRMGPYRAGDCYLNFSLDDRQEYVVSASISSGIGTYSFEMYCGGIESGTDYIRLTQVPPEGAADAASGNRYPMTRELRALLQGSPPIDGARYYAHFNEDGQITNLNLSNKTTGHAIAPAVLDSLSQAIDAQSLREMHELDLTYESVPDLTDQYFWPARRLGLSGQTWTSPQQLNPEMLLSAYEFYDFGQTYLIPDLNPGVDLAAISGSEFLVPREVVEEHIGRFAAVFPEALRSSDRYNPEHQAYRMMFLYGVGDGSWSELNRAWWSGDILLLEVDTDGDTDYLLLERSGDDPLYLAVVHVPFGE